MPLNSLNPADRILTEDEVAALTSFSTRTLQAWRQRNVGPPFMRVRRSIRYSQADVLAWMKAQTHDPEASNMIS
jgi:predicted DNA-binding transcriptional regulator AlpA